jgi:peptidoglycan/xylan/chitin deacetylase (PgdA/CDA1 family)
MAIRQLAAQYYGSYRRNAQRFLFRQPVRIVSDVPLISFTFDDFPRSALMAGGGILKRAGLAGTYYVSLGLMGKQAPVGTIFSLEDLKAVLAQGHELGCHTFAHCHSWETKPDVFEHSVIANRLALKELLPGALFKTFSYPISPPRPRTKQKMSRHFVCCRGGGQTFNSGTADLNYLKSFFLEQANSDARAVKYVIDQNQQARGWLIFSTHDVSANPSPFGCTPGFFEEIVQYAADSGARILPVVQVCEALRSRTVHNGHVTEQRP